MSKGNLDGDGIEQYVHKDKKRPYNPPVGLVTPDTDADMPRKKYSFDPHLDPQLTWSGKKENPDFEVDTVSLHVHERIDPLTIIEKILKKEEFIQQSLFHYFETPENNPPLREAIQFYKHSQNWSNRLIAGDSLLVMNSLLQKEAVAGKVQMIYFDPPYGIKYGSNFQPFINKRDVKDGNDEDLTQEPEMIKAFRDTWELGTHSYLSYLRDRLLLARELLSESGSIFIQIGDENVHHVREVLDEVFGHDNFLRLISWRSTMGSSDEYLPQITSYILWYAKDKTKVKTRSLFVNRTPGNEGARAYDWIEEKTGECRRLSPAELEGAEKIPEGRVFRLGSLYSQHPSETRTFSFEFNGTKFHPGASRQWATSLDGLERLKKMNRLISRGNTLYWVLYLDEVPTFPLTNVWTDTVRAGFTGKNVYVVQTNTKVVDRCVLMTTDPGDLVLDPTCGSGTTAFVAEKWGRRWITCDTSRVAIAIAKQRLMTATFDYYELAHPEEGVSSGFRYDSVPHLTLGSIANKEPTASQVLLDKPIIDRSKKRVSGPFTVEAVPSPQVISETEVDRFSHQADSSIARSGESIRTVDWINELKATGIRGIKGREREKIEFARLEPLGATRYLHAEGETKESEPKRVAVSFGSAYAPLEQKQVELAIEEAQKLVPKPKIIIFASFQFDPEAAKDIDELEWPGVSILKVQMNTDLFTEDLKKRRSSNESFWLVGQPDIEVEKKGKNYVVKVSGFDYYNPKSGEIESGDVSKIAMWMLDTDYDGRSLYPKQTFFPMAGENEGWGKLAKNLKGELDEEALESVFKGGVSLPFALGNKKRIGVKIIDDRGIESLRIIEVNE